MMRDLSKPIASALGQGISLFPNPRISKLAPQQLTGAQRILIQHNKRCWIIQVDSLTLLESNGNYTRLHSGKSRPMIARSLNYMQKRLDPAMFFRANRRTIINLQHVKLIKPWVNGGFMVRLDSGSEIEVSRRQGQLLKKQMMI